MTSAEQLTLFDLIGRDWSDDEAQSVVSHLGDLRAVELHTAGIYDFRSYGVKIFTDKTGGENEISEILIREAPDGFDRRLLERLPCDLRIRQPQEQVRAMLGEPYDSHLGYTYPPPRMRDEGCALPHREDGWDRYHSSQLAERFKIHPLKPFLLTIEYPLGWGGLKQIRDADEKILLIIPEYQRLGEVILKRWNDDLPPRAGISSVEEILKRDFRSWKIFE
ncbi:MAG: hypothetical protein MOB07_26935 [Acidobacteria bacterium]|nr:hypothetical protein [Acidobacteriota bacterium]